MTVREMNKEDIEAVFELGHGCEEFTTENGSFWSKEQLQRWCNSPDDLLLVAEENGRIIGFSLYAVHIPTGKVTWENLYVDPEMRGRGIAAALIEEGHLRLKAKGYSYLVLQDNSTDQERFAHYLERFGFKKGSKVLWLDTIL